MKVEKLQLCHAGEILDGNGKSPVVDLTTTEASPSSQKFQAVSSSEQSESTGKASVNSTHSVASVKDVSVIPASSVEKIQEAIVAFSVDQGTDALL